ncbi:unnamed protein product, partial [marine sediment metagenome]
GRKAETAQQSYGDKGSQEAERQQGAAESQTPNGNRGWWIRLFHLRRVPRASRGF